MGAVGDSRCVDRSPSRLHERRPAALVCHGLARGLVGAQSRRRRAGGNDVVAAGRVRLEQSGSA